MRKHDLIDFTEQQAQNVSTFFIGIITLYNAKLYNAMLFC